MSLTILQARKEMRHKMNGFRSRKNVLPILKKSAVLTCAIVFADAVGVMATSISLWRNLAHYFTLLSLLEAALLFLIAGAKDLAESLAFTKVTNGTSRAKRTWTFDGHRQAQERAAPYVLAGIFLLVLSFILAYPLG